MNEFIEKNKGLLKFYCLAARIIGWALMLIPLALIVLALLWNQLGGQTRLPPPEISLAHIGYFILGLLVLGIGQFIRHLFQTESKPGWILRHGDKILYLYAAFTVVGAGSIIRLMFYLGHGYPIKYVISTGFLFLPPALAKAFVLIGLAHILRRIMPVIKESKTLV